MKVWDPVTGLCPLGNIASALSNRLVGKWWNMPPQSQRQHSKSFQISRSHSLMHVILDDELISNGKQYSWTVFSVSPYGRVPDGMRGLV
jgi:hypothetical protein